MIFSAVLSMFSLHNHHASHHVFTTNHHAKNTSFFKTTLKNPRKNEKNTGAHHAGFFLQTQRFFRLKFALYRHLP